MTRPDYPNAFYESHFVRDATGQIIGLKFGDRTYLAAGPPEAGKRYMPPAGQGKLNGPDSKVGLEKEIGNKEALSLMELVNLGGSLPVIEHKDGIFYGVNLSKYKPKEGNKLYVEVLDKDARAVKIYEGPQNLSFPDLNKGQQILEGRIYGASRIGRLLVYK